MFSSAFNSSVVYTDLRIAYAEPHSEEQVFNRKEKVNCDKEIKKLDYTTLYNAIDYTIKPKEEKMIRKMENRDSNKDLRRVKNIDKELSFDDKLTREMKKRFKLK